MQSEMSRPNGFTLVELLVVVAIIGVLVGISLPAVHSLRAAALRTECSNKIRQIAMAVATYESSFRRFPSGIKSAGDAHFPSSTWLTHLLPYVEHGALWARTIESYQNNPSPFSPHEGLQTVVPLFVCPSNPGADMPQFTHGGRLVGLTSYLGVNGTDYTKRNGVFYLGSETRTADVTDGLSNTLLIGERPPSPDFWYGWWYAGLGQRGSGSPDMLLGVSEMNDGARFMEFCPPGPYQFGTGHGKQCDAFHYWSRHATGANFAIADGSVRFVGYAGSELLPFLATRGGGEAVNLPD